MPALQSAKELRAERKKLHVRMTELLAKPAGEKNDLSAEQRSEFDKLDAEIKRLGIQAETIERAEELERELADSKGPIAGGRETEDRSGEREEKTERVANAFDNYLRRGMNGLNAEDREIMARRFVEERAQGTNIDTAGGYLAPEEFQPVVEKALLAFGGMRQARTRKLSTANGNDLLIPTSDDTSNTGAIVGENNVHSTQDMTFGQVKLGSYLYSSKIIKVSRQLLQDSAVDVPSLIGEAAGERIGRIQNTHLTTGDAASKPNGVVTAATLGVTGAAGQTTSFIYNDFVDLVHSVGSAYRPNAQFMFADSSLKIIRKLKDGEGRPLWQPGLAVREPDSILGYSYVINDDVAAAAASAKSILFGDFSKYWIRDVNGLVVLRLEERYAEYLQVAFLVFSRMDGNLIDAGTHPIKYFQHNAA